MNSVTNLDKIDEDSESESESNESFISDNILDINN